MYCLADQTNSKRKQMASPTASHDKSLEEKGKGNVNLKTKLEAKKVVMHVSLASFIASHDKSLKEKGKGNVNLKRKRKGKKPSPVALASRIASHYKSLKEEGKGNVNLKRKRKGKKPSSVALASRIASHYKSLKEEGKGNVKPRMSVSDHVARDAYPFVKDYAPNIRCCCNGRCNMHRVPDTHFLGIYQIREVFPNFLVQPPVSIAEYVSSFFKQEDRMGTTFSRINAGNFNSFIDSGNLVDLNMGRHRYTRVLLDGSKASRLDRFLVNQQFLDMAPDLVLEALDDILSDHRPLLLSRKKMDFGPVPFKFYNSWLEIHGFENIVTTSWSSNDITSNKGAFVRIKEKLKILKNEVKNWNKQRKETVQK